MNDGIENKFYLRWGYGYLPALILVSLIVCSSVVAATYFLSYKSSLIIEKWNCEGKVGSDEEWNTSYSKLNLAKTINPWNADIYMSLGDLYEWKLAGKSNLDDSVKDIRQNAIKYYVEAINHRPTWAQAWSKLAKSKLLNSEVSSESFHAIEMGFKYGKWQPEISKNLIWLSIGFWGVLPENLKNTVRRQVESQIKNNVPISSFAVLALRFKWFDELLSLDMHPRHKDYLRAAKNNPKLLKNAIRNSFNGKKDFVC